MVEGTEVRSRAAGFVRGNVVLVASAVLAIASMALVPPSPGYADYIDFRTLGILFCFMAVVTGMRECHLFGALAGRLLAGRRSLRALCLILVLLPFFCSMVITNDVALITFVPFTILVLGMAGERASILPVVVLQTVAANLGSMLLPFGNPQNLYIHSHYALGTGELVSLLAPYVVLGGAALCLLCVPFGSREVHVEMSRDRELRSRGLLTLMTVLFVLCVLAVLRVVPWQAVLAVTVLSVAVARPGILGRVDYGLLLTFVFLFVFTGNVAQIEPVRDALERLMGWDPMLASLGMSQVISNVPAATMLSGFTDDWQDLLVGVDVGGFGTPIASMASMISLGLYARTEGADVRRYLVLFTAVNVLMVVLLTLLHRMLRSVAVAMDAGGDQAAGPLRERLTGMPHGYYAEREPVIRHAEDLPHRLHPLLHRSDADPACAEAHRRRGYEDVLGGRAHVLLPHHRDGHVLPDPQEHDAERRPARRLGVGGGARQTGYEPGIVHDHELPGLLVPGGGRAHGGLDQPGRVLVRYGIVRELPDAPPHQDGVRHRRLPLFLFCPGLYALRYFRTSWSDSESDHSGV